MAIKDNVPGFFCDIPEIAALFAAAQTETDRVDSAVKTAAGKLNGMTDGYASHWERMLGFEPTPAWSDERRRERIRSRLYAASPMSPAMLKSIVEKAAHTEVELTENAAASTVNIKFVGEYGISPYLDDVRAELARQLPAHMRAAYEFVFATYAQISAFTNSAMAAFSYDSIRNGGMIN